MAIKKLEIQLNKKIKINIKKLIEFYDVKEDGITKPASSITGIIGEDLIAGLFKHYQEEYLKEKISIQVLTNIPKKGKWLDRWIIQIIDNCKIAYQTEIKNWSAHSLGGVNFKELNLNDSKFKLKAEEIFSNTFKEDKFCDKSVGKVLNYMNDTLIEKEFGKENIKPLVYFWMPICEKNEPLKPFFTIKLDNQSIEDNSGRFKEVSFFSASIYLRKLLEENKHINNEISIEAPNIFERIDQLNSLVPI